MTKKKKSKPMKKPKAKPHPDLYHLMMVLKYTERNIKNDGSDMDSLFKAQAERVKERIRGLG
jgi:hypothetical protein